MAHASQLITIGDVTRLARQTGLARVRLLRRPAVFETARLSPADGQPAQQVALFLAQLFDRGTLPGYCAELFGSADGALVIRCDAHGSIAAADYLSDPDLMNNHGLSVAANAGFAAGMIGAMRPAGNRKPVYLDTAPDQLLDTGEGDARAQDYTRDPVDMARFFAYRSLRAGIAFLRGRPEPPRRCWRDPLRRRWTWPSGASSSRPT